ncbi:MAG: hypothetical protein Kow00114_08890 [Kiloniellaceae bacterium]
MQLVSGETTVEANKNVVRRYVEKFNAGDLAGLRALFADDALIYGVLGWGKVDDVMPIWRQLVESLAMQRAIEDIVAEGDVVAVRYTERGIARAAFFDKPATGRSYELTAMEWFIVQDGTIRRRWGARDGASQARQLGWDQPPERRRPEPAAGANA